MARIVESENTRRINMPKLTDIEGIGITLARKLRSGGVGSTDALLLRGANKNGRRVISKTSGIDESRILRFVNQVDLMRVRGIGAEYAELLEAAGVDTVPELAGRNPSNLARALREVNAKKHLVRAVPTEIRISNWIAQARRLGRVVTH